MPANMENSAGATGLEKGSFHSNPKERQCQRMFKSVCESLSHVQLLVNPWTVACQAPLSMEFSRPGFNSTWIMNFQMFKLDLEKERYTHLNSEFQRIARRDKKVFLSNQCCTQYVSKFGKFSSGLEKVSFYSNPIKRQCQRILKLPHNCTHLTC